MTAQEQQLLQGLTERISKTPLNEKDPEAEQYLQQTLGRNPDALYVLAQTVLVQQYALDNAQKQLADLRTQLDEAQQQAQRSIQQQVPQPKHTSFLGNLLGLDKDDPPQPQQTPYTPVQTNPRPGSFAANQYAPPPPPYNYPPQYGSPQYAPPQQYGAPQFGGQQYGAPQQGSFLRSAATTAAGVAAGALAFEGIESLMHGFGGHESRGMGDFSGGGQPREETINNYYGDSGTNDRQERSEHHGLSDDIEDRRNNFADTSSNDDDKPVQQDDDNGDFSRNDDTQTQDDDNGDFSSNDDDTN